MIKYINIFFTLEYVGNFQVCKKRQYTPTLIVYSYTKLLEKLLEVSVL